MGVTRINLESGGQARSRLRYGARASGNPWDARGLEWTVASPPPKENFATVPRVDSEAYAYDTPQ